MKLLIINGANLNLLGERESHVYGSVPFDTYLKDLKNKYPEVEIDYFQSNIEGELIDKLQQSDQQYDGIVINPGGYSHTSVSIADAIKAMNTAIVEVHISNLFAREAYRHISLTGAAAKGVIMGMGLDVYRLGVQSFL